jgi:hypothetical protein
MPSTSTPFLARRCLDQSTCAQQGKYSLNFQAAGLILVDTLRVGVGGVIYAGKTLRVIQGQLNEIKAAGTQTDQMLVQASSQAESTKRSVEVWMNSERAWLYLEPRQGALSVGSRFTQMVLIVRNGGKTPGRIVKIDYGFTIRQLSLSTGPRLSNEPGSTLEFVHLLVPGAEKNVYLSHPKQVSVRMGQLQEPGPPFTPGEMEQINAQLTHHLYVHGSLAYLDLAKVERRTDFCFEYLPSGPLVDGRALFWRSNDQIGSVDFA